MLKVNHLVIFFALISANQVISFLVILLPFLVFFCFLGTSLLIFYDFSILFLDKLLDKPYGPFVLDEINRKTEKQYITNCKSVFLAGGPKEDIVMPAELLGSTTPSPNKLKRENNHIFMFIFYILLPNFLFIS